jgi:DUF1680 family protein
MKRFIALTLVVAMLLSLFGCIADEKIFSKAKPLNEKLEDINMQNVMLLDSYEQNAFNLEIKYLKSLNADKFLKGFCEIGGVDLDAEKYGGWETSAIQGHTLGHYLTAVAQAYASSGDNSLKEITDYMVSVLSKCQGENGYLAAIPESHYSQIENGNTSGTWVPWYSMHKILAGLVDVYKFTNNPTALTIASKLGDWVYSRTSKWTPEMQNTVLNVEYGGMNDCLYELYKYTKNENHLSAAHSFDELTLFEPLYNGEDILNGKHANTTIPKIIGALNRYRVTGEEYYLQVAANFWDIVINNHTYITGGNSEWEHFGESKILDAERTNCNCETCNTYNMLKLSRELFKITGDVKYADYYENTFINAILSSQNPETGMTTYFQPMATGFFKVYSTPYDHFWCCTGSGMENFSKLSDSIYFHNSTSLYVNRFTSSKVFWQEKGIEITQTADLPNVKFTINGSANGQIVLRVPDWTNNPTVKINGEEIKVKATKGLITIDREWHDGDIIEYNLPMQVVAYTLPDNENAVAFKYGPYVLSANMGTNEMHTTTTGVDVTIPLWDSTVNDTLIIEKGTIKNWLKDINKNVVQDENTLNFTLKGTNQKLVFSPHYLQYKNRYGIYFRLADSNTEIPTNEADKYIIIDSLPIGNDQYEFSHNLKAENSTAGNFKGLMFRDASPRGWFSYDLAIDNTTTNYLAVKYYSGDVGRTFKIYVDNELLANVVLQDPNPNGFYDMYYEIPQNMVAYKEKITVTFKATEESFAGGIFDKLSTIKEK